MKILTKIQMLLLCLAAAVVGPGSQPAWSQTVTNSWTSSTSGNWEDLTWSLGVRPAANQSVLITNSGSKAVAISPTTRINFPATMTITNLTISAPSGYNNTLLLNYSGTSTPLRVLNEVDLLDGGILNNQYGGLKVEGALLAVGGKVLMEGGSLTVTNGWTRFVNATSILNQAQCTLSNAMVYNGTVFQLGGEVRADLEIYGNYFLSNGVFRGDMTVGEVLNPTGYCSQTGGTNFASVFVGNGSYNLTNGIIAGGVTLGRYASFNQVNSTVNGAIAVGGYIFPVGFATYSMYGGTNQLRSMGVGSGGHFNQSGGINFLTNDFSASGFFDTYGPVGFGSYSLNSGLFSCSNVNLGLFGSFGQSGGTNIVRDQLTVNYGAHYYLSGGILQTSNTFLSPDYHYSSDITFGSYFTQSSGTNTIADTLSLSGYYELSGGTLAAKDIVLQSSAGSLFTIAGTTSAPVVINPGQFVAGGALRLAGSIQQLGVLRLAGNATFDFTQTPGELRFLNSSAVAWTNAAILTVTNWSGSTNGGGANRFVVGNSSSALTSAQLLAIRFVNPAGFPAGSYVAGILGTGEIVPVVRVNSWTGSGSGNWDSLTWSAGVLPSGPYSIFITNAGSKAVAIQPSTPVNNPATMTIRDLRIGGQGSDVNTLLLNFSGAANPLHILEFCAIATNGVLNNQYGAVLIDGSGPALTIKGKLVQESGILSVPQGDVVMNSSTATVQNSTCLFSTLSCSNAVFSQIAGTVTNQGVLPEYADYFRYNVRLDAGSRYVLTNGVFSGSVRMTASTFQQYGGTNSSTGSDGLSVEGGGSYEMTEGVFVGDINIRNGSFAQTNGAVKAASPFVDDGNYIQNGGTMDANQIYVDYTGNYSLLAGEAHVQSLSVYGAFIQSGGFVQVGSGSPFIPGSYSLAAGTFSATNATLSGAFVQSAGTSVVADTLTTYGTYSIKGGVSSVSNMVLESTPYYGTANLVISNLSAPVINNPGLFSLFGTVTFAGSTQQLGSLILAGDSVIDFTKTPGQLKFLNSAATWTNGATLTISNWVGAAAGNGADRFVVGNNSGSLTSAQLGQIRFVNPAGFSPGTYFADVLATGEVVPTVRPHLATTLAGDKKIVLTWPATFTLESATNVQGPYLTVPGATSPYTNTLSEPRRFFRLRQ